MRVVIDSNVLVSRFLSPTGAPAKLFEQWEDQAFQLLVSEPIMAEYQRALMYERVAARHRLSADGVADVIAGLRHFALLVEPTENIAAISDDPDDNKFLDCAAAGGADYLVSGDTYLLRLQEFRGVQVLSPATFLAMLEQEPGG